MSPLLLAVRVENGGAAFLNRCALSGISLRQCALTPALCCLIRRKDLGAAEKIAASLGCRIEILAPDGVSRALDRVKRRVGLILWPFFITGLLLFSQCFAWKISVNGTDTLSSALVLKTAEETGLKKGAFLPTLDTGKTADRILLELPQVAYCAVNRIGATVEIEIKEAAAVPEILPTDPCSVIAAETGRIVYMEVTAGTESVKTGGTVGKGQLIVSGVTESADGKTRFVHASAKVIADAVFTRTFTLPLTEEEKIPTGKTRTRYRLLLFGQEIPLSFPARDDPEKGWEKSERKKALSVFGIRLPAGILISEEREYTPLPHTLSPEEAALRLRAAAAEWEAENLSSAEILSREEIVEEEENAVRLTVSYTARMDIAQEKKIEISKNP